MLKLVIFNLQGSLASLIFQKNSFKTLADQDFDQQAGFARLQVKILLAGHSSTCQYGVAWYEINAYKS